MDSNYGIGILGPRRLVRWWIDSLEPRLVWKYKGWSFKWNVHHPQVWKFFLELGQFVENSQTLHPRKLTWNPKIVGLDMFLLFPTGYFPAVSFQGCKKNWTRQNASFQPVSNPGMPSCLNEDLYVNPLGPIVKMEPPKNAVRQNEVTKWKCRKSRVFEASKHRQRLKTRRPDAYYVP